MENIMEYRMFDSVDPRDPYNFVSPTHIFSQKSIEPLFGMGLSTLHEFCFMSFLECLGFHGIGILVVEFAVALFFDHSGCF